MQRSWRLRWSAFAAVLGTAGAVGNGWAADAPAPPQAAQTKPAPAKPDPAAVERTRKTVRMLDDVYKTAVVLITDKYVDDEKDFPAGGAAIALFGEIKKKGWHEVRLIDISGQPYEAKNVAKDAFEKQAVAALKGGKAFVDEVAVQDGKNVLRAATPIPVVLQKCTLCHPNYKDAKPGAAIGALIYTLPIE